MSSRQKIVLAVSAVIVLALIIWGGTKRGGTPEAAPTGGESSAGPSAPGFGAPPALIPYSPEVPKNAVETKPHTEFVSDPGEPSKVVGIFALEAAPAGFAPASLNVKVNEFVTIELTSKAGDADLSIPGYGVYLKSPKGEMKSIRFKATQTGTFGFECRDFCPGGKKIFGSLVVLP